MVIYIIASLPLLLLLCMRVINNKKNSYFQVALAMLPLFLLMAFKGLSVGSDTKSYVNGFNSMCLGWKYYEKGGERIEIGYKIFLWLLTCFTKNYQWQFIIFALFSFFVITSFFYKNSDNPLLCCVLFLGLNLYSFYMTGIRQAFAMTICLLAYGRVKKHRPISFIIITLIAYSFHKSALFFFPVYIFANLKVNKFSVMLYFICAVLVAIFNEQIFALGGEFFDIQYGIEETRNGYVMFGIMLIITVFSFVLLRDLLNKDKNNNRLIMLNLVATLLWLLRMFSRTAERPSFYYTFFSILLIDQMVSCVKLRSKGIKDVLFVEVAVPLLGFMYFIYRLIVSTTLIPFTFFWQ